MKKCIYCGKELPDQASWCPFCEKEQQEVKEVPVPSRRRRKIIGFTAAAILLCACGIWIYMRHSPKVYEGGAKVLYKIDGKDCSVFLSFRSDAYKTGKETAELIDRVRQGNTSAIPSQLYAWSAEDPDIQDAFASRVKSCTVSANPEKGASAVQINGPDPADGNAAGPAWAADIVYGPDTGTNTLCWEVTMKNGDILRLYQTVTCELQPVIEYHYEDMPMDTLEEVSALIEKAALEEDPDALLELYLPPVTYEGELVLDQRTAILYGSEEDGKKTTFTGTVRVKTRIPALAEFYELEFQGNGGTAIISTDALRVQACLFQGWDVGIDMEDGAWVSVSNAAFVGNQVGFLFNSHSCTFSNPNYENVVFAENDIGLQIKSVPKDIGLNFIGTVFDGNETDVDDPKGLVQLS